MFKIRPATIEDAPVIGELVYLAAKGSYPTSGYDLSLGGDRNHQVAELTKLATARTRSWFHFSHFTVAEAQGRVVAGAAGFDRLQAERDLPQALVEIGWTMADLTALDEKLQPVAGAFPAESANIWTIENVAVLPEWRRHHLAKRCVAAVLNSGLAAGFQKAKLDVFASNIAAVSLYQSLGFQISETINHPTFRTILNRGALHRMLIDL